MTTDTNRALVAKAPLPCPFCGKSYFITGYGMGTRAKIRCTSCEAGGPIALDGEPEAIAAWNRRAAPLPVEDVAGMAGALPRFTWSRVDPGDMDYTEATFGFGSKADAEEFRRLLTGRQSLASPAQGAENRARIDALIEGANQRRVAEVKADLVTADVGRLVEAVTRHVFTGALKYAFGRDATTNDRLTLEQREAKIQQLSAEALAAFRSGGPK